MLDLITCTGSEFLSVKAINSRHNDFIGFKYLKGTDLVSDCMFSFLSEGGRLVGIMKYSIEERRSRGIKGLLGATFIYIRLNFIDIRSDKKGNIKKELVDVILDEFCDYINTLGQSKKLVNISTFKGYESDISIEDVLYYNVNKIKIIKKGRVKYGK